jgi:DNA-binding MarR family transcriptional regulator
VPTADRVATLFGAMSLVAADTMREATERAAGLSDAAPAALASLLPVGGGRSIDELRRVVGLTPSGGVRLVDRMAQAGLVERRPGTDRRTVMVALTGRGRRVARAVLAARDEALERLLRSLGVTDRAALESLASAILESNVLDRLERRADGDTPVGGWICRLCDQERCGRPRGLCPAARATT